ncbi:flagellar hook protein FlgE [Castellaniella sp.]|uniref:flagellar hook protein FlgE n=1 Tax=Castellaniella sp. TaxID=1955812 RepID=UPI00356290CD
MSFGQSLSGLSAAAKNLDVIGNNIANSATVGYKSGSVTFSDVYSNSVIGLGVNVSGISQDFSSGTLSSTGNQLDMAIDGDKGLFVLQDKEGSLLFTRNGQFFPDSLNHVVNAQGYQLMGYAPGGTNLVGLQIPAGNLAPQASTTLDNRVNLDASVPEVPAAVVFDADDPATYSNVVPVTVYDSLGNKHRLMQYYTKREAAGGMAQWEVNFQLDGQAPDNAASLLLSFDSAGALDPAAVSAATMTFSNLVVNGAPVDDLDIRIDYEGSSQYSSGFTQSFQVDGFASGEFSSISIATNGEMVAHYTNGEKSVIGIVVLADFNNVLGLRSVGGNAWVESGDSGQPIFGIPGSNGLASIMGQMVEESNVDISKSLVDMIMAQRTYQANAQSIKTQDQMMQTLITMR